MTYEEWLIGLGEYRSQNPSQKAGQAAFNFLDKVRADLARRIQEETNLDPYYNNSDDAADRIRLKRFYNYVEENWDADD